MSRYNAIEDPLCYPGTHVLKNKLDLTDQSELDQFEQLMFLTRSEEPLPAGELDYEYYKAIHHHFFQDVYDWAGKPREIRTGKGDSWFCYPEFIEQEMVKIFAQLASENHLTLIEDPITFAKRAAYYVAEINAVHPFLEGNGRCQLTLLSILFEISGFPMDVEQIQADQFMAAMVASFYGNNGPLIQAIMALMA
ncbi:Fic/DOC family protein [Pseudovibrio sp. WM33]|uniref:Fic/DOC family protein n=1 Tax=Pseudovibrio sp. WM33 TaxID=1735585 RepID=UPI0007AE8042|nr:Fic family protein [Pseudovibrio sp. WM33]KZL26348.1 Adenosine monophosphate-protein transferase VbhT [Pseudovibrio sp. WM33]